MDRTTLRAISAEVINGKLLEGALLSIPLEEKEVDPEVMRKIKSFVYGERPANFTPEWWDLAAALANSVYEKYPETYEPMKKAFLAIAEINEVIFAGKAVDLESPRET